MKIKIRTTGNKTKAIENVDMVSRLDKYAVTLVLNKEKMETKTVQVDKIVEISGHISINKENGVKLERYKIEGPQFQTKPWLWESDGQEIPTTSIQSIVNIKVCPGCGIHSTHSDFDGLKCKDCSK